MAATVAEPLAAAPADAGRGAYRLAVALVLVTLVAIAWGAMVASTGSGLAFADWPQSDGSLMPERALTTLPGFLEHFHRIVAGLAGVLAVALAAVVCRRSGARAPAGRAALLGLLLIALQGIVGGVGVLLQLPVLMSALHGTLAQITLATFAVTAYLLSPRRAATPPVHAPAAGAAQRLTVVAVLLLVLQAVLGAIARHSGSEPVLWTHVGNALVVFLLVTCAAALAVGRLAAVPGVGAL